MTNEYTSEQVLALAPDAASQKSGQELANTRKWRSLAKGDNAVWGECQGSGSKPYLARADLDGPAFKCTCPSRKFPCKHGIGLMLLYALSPSSFREAETPAWVKEWLEGRRQRQQKKTKGDADAERTPEQLEESRLAKEKRRANRMDSVKAGVEELELFLSDLIRQGVGHIKNESYSYFEARAARLIDAQAPGLARLIRECAAITSSKTDWQETLLNQLSTIYLIARAFRNIDNLSPEMREDVLAAVGFTQSQEALLEADGVADKWFVIGQSVYTEEKLRVQKSYLWGRDCKKIAMILNFAHGINPFDIMLIPGHFYDAEVVYFPSVYPLRALVKSYSKSDETESKTPLPSGESSIETSLKEYARALSCLPWLEEIPMLISGQVLVADRDRMIYSTDEGGAALPLVTAGSAGWQLMAFSSGLPLSLFGQYDGIKFTPLAAIHDKRGTYMRLSGGADGGGRAVP